MHLRDAAVALSSEELGVFGDSGPAELPFLNVWRYLRRLSDAVPDVYDVSTDQRLLLIEDVGDVTLWAAALGEANAAALFEEALCWIADLQVRARFDERCFAFRQAFDRRLFSWEFEHFVEYGLAGTSGALLTEVRRELADAASELAALPRVFCHRDYHAWNIHRQADGRLRVFDFQDALLGPRLYDVASLLTDRTTPELIGPEVERRLVAGFAQRLPRATWSDEDELFAQYHLVALQRVLKVVGRFNYLAEVKGKHGYLAMLPTVARTAERLLRELGSRLPATLEALVAHGKTGSPAGHAQ